MNRPAYRLFLDVQAAQSDEHGGRGIGRYALRHAHALSERPGLVSRIALNPLIAFPPSLDLELLSHPGLVWNTKRELDRAREEGAVAYHMMSPFEIRGTIAQAAAPPHALSDPRIPLIVTLYDLIPLRFADHYLADRNFARRYRARLEVVRQADLVLTISEHTRRDALELLGLDAARVVCIGAGVSSFFHPPQEGEAPARLLRRYLPAISKPYVLSVTGAERRKNTEGLIRAFSMLPRELRDNLQLVLACYVDDHHRRAWLAEASRHGLEEGDVVLTDRVTDAVLRALYQQARLFVLASFYEGFGLPAAEAAACYCPVVVSNTSALGEILQSDAATFDPADPSCIAAAMEQALSDGAARQQLCEIAMSRSRAHTWESVAEKTAMALENLDQRSAGAPGSPPAVRSTRLKVALVGPFPPIRSGIADYNSRLAGELGGLCDLDVLTVGDFDRKISEEMRHARYFPVGALGKTLNPMSYDHIVYTFGNNHHHHRTYERVLRYPGVLWLHDVRLPLFYLSYAINHLPIESWGVFMAEKLTKLYGPRAPHHLVSRLSYLFEEYIDFGMGMTAELVKASTAVIVNSGVAHQLLALDLGPGVMVPPVGVIPLAVPRLTERGPQDRIHRPGSGPPVIASFGFAAEVKAPDLMMQALALVRKRIPARLVFVGPMQETLGQSLAEQAASLGIETAVEFTEDLPEPEYQRWLFRATCAVQLRNSTNGESSAAISDCLAAGLPVITNIPACREMPAGTVDFLSGEISPERLAAHMQRLLSDDAIRAEYTAAAMRYAGENTFHHASVRLLNFLETLQHSRAIGPLVTAHRG